MKAASLPVAPREVPGLIAHLSTTDRCTLRYCGLAAGRLPPLQKRKQANLRRLDAGDAGTEVALWVDNYFVKRFTHHSVSGCRDVAAVAAIPQLYTPRPFVLPDVPQLHGHVVTASLSVELQAKAMDVWLAEVLQEFPLCGSVRVPLDTVRSPKQ